MPVDNPVHGSGTRMNNPPPASPGPDPSPLAQRIPSGHAQGSHLPHDPRWSGVPGLSTYPPATTSN
jgi:hypothetical protein